MTAVVAQHCGLLPFGWTGVWLFFVISGYVVTLSVIGRPSDLPAKRRLTDFFGRRARRIVPVYYAYVGAGVLVCIATGSTIDILAAGSLFGFFNNIAMAAWRGELSGWPVGHLWTISVEMQFYVLYGMVLILSPRWAVLLFLVSALIIAPLTRLAASDTLSALGWSDGGAAYMIYSGSLLHTDSFAAGALLAFASKRGLISTIARPLALGGILALFAYSTAYVGFNYAVAGARGVDVLKNVLSGILWGQFREVIVYTVLAFAGSGLVALAVAEDRWTAWLLRHRLVQRIGEISYGAYVFHALAIVVAAQLLSPIIDMSLEERPIVSKIALLVLSYLMTVFAAELSFRRFENRFRGATAQPPGWQCATD